MILALEMRVIGNKFKVDDVFYEVTEEGILKNNNVISSREFLLDTQKLKYIHFFENNEYVLRQLMTSEDIAFLESLNESQQKYVPEFVTMGQTRSALIRSGLFDVVNNAIMNSNDPILISDWEYRTEVRRDWPELINISSSLGLSTEQIDDLFLFAETL